MCVCVCVCVCVRVCVCVCVWCRDEDADIKHTRAPQLSVVSFAKTPFHHLPATREMPVKTSAGLPTGLLKKFAEGVSGLELWPDWQVDSSKVKGFTGSCAL